MANAFTPVTTIAQLEQVMSDTASDPIVLFQHDPYCPISQYAYQQMRRLTYPISLINVSQHHDLTEAIEERTGIRHESPQVIVLKQGDASWSASHYAITQEAVEEALQADERTS